LKGEETFSQPKETKSKSRGSKFKAEGRKIQGFSFRELRSFNGLTQKSKRRRSPRHSGENKTGGGSQMALGAGSTPPTAGTITGSSDYRKWFSLFLVLP
jgi:hypothetical protein